VLLGDDADETHLLNLQRLKHTFGDRAYMALIRRFAPNEHLRLWQVEQAVQAAGVPTVAMGDVLYHHPTRRMLQDVVSCIRQGCTIDAAGFRLERHADRFLKDPAEMARLLRPAPRSPGANRARSSGAAVSPSMNCVINILAKRIPARPHRRSWSG
jgi:error-prone DNA polymerase